MWPGDLHPAHLSWRGANQGNGAPIMLALPNDCVGAELRKYGTLPNYRYEEIDLLARDVIKKLLYVSSYHTTGLNGATGLETQRLSLLLTCP